MGWQTGRDSAQQHNQGWFLQVQPSHLACPFSQQRTKHFHKSHSPHSGSVELARELANLSQLREAKLSKDTWLSKWQYRDEHLHFLASVLEPCPTAPPPFGSTSFHSTQLYKQSPVQTAVPSTWQLPGFKCPMQLSRWLHLGKEGETDTRDWPFCSPINCRSLGLN